MSVDDNTFLSDKGKPINKTKFSESELLKQMSESGIFNRHPNTKAFIIGDSGLSTLEDHNYRRYLASFERVVGNHLSKIEQYRENHPECPFLAFLIMDESRGYFESLSIIDTFNAEDVHLGRPHCQFADESFVDVFRNSGVDCVIWMAPYKLWRTVGVSFPLPIITVYFKGLEYLETNTYIEQFMYPNEV